MCFLQLGYLYNPELFLNVPPILHHQFPLYIVHVEDIPSVSAMASSGLQRWVSLVVMFPCHPLAICHLLIPVIVVPSLSSSPLRIVVVVISSSS